MTKDMTTTQMSGGPCVTTAGSSLNPIISVYRSYLSPDVLERSNYLSSILQHALTISFLIDKF
jgi:hypothetical protein